MFGQDRSELRKLFFTAWRKAREQAPMEPLEQVIATIIGQHPEYHGLLEDEDGALDRDYSPEQGETNPFLHMAMHIAIHEQLSTRRPAGIVSIYQSLIKKYSEPHEVEHRMMECLGEMLWQAQRENTLPSEEAYLACLKRLVNTQG